MAEPGIKIWGRKDSSNVQKVLWCCAELDLEYQRVDLGGRFGGNRDPSYLRLNPNGLVPTIEDRGFVLWESNSIVRYLIDKYGNGKLTPSTAEKRASANRWMDWQLTTLGPPMATLFWALIRTPQEKRDPTAIDQALEKSAQAWQIFDEHLAKSVFAAGEEFSYGDIPLGVWVHRWFNLPIERPSMPNLAQWYARLASRKAYQDQVMIPLS
ncbi:MAG TPA: glutathione S-transferase family protein [Candidatus Acidoferrales bacterium]|nr:glutathione S-transferase family protein [Candidatus Acidoferrales bacterium]